MCERSMEWSASEVPDARSDVFVRCQVQPSLALEQPSASLRCRQRRSLKPGASMPVLEERYVQQVCVERIMKRLCQGQHAFVRDVQGSPLTDCFGRLAGFATQIACRSWCQTTPLTKLVNAETKSLWHTCQSNGLLTHSRSDGLMTRLGLGSRRRAHTMPGGPSQPNDKVQPPAQRIRWCR
jgi:hypothetical protein